MTIVLSAKASRQLEELLDYLETEWSPQTSIIYRINGSVIEVVAFLDNRQA